MEKVESALDVLSRAATMVQPSPAYPASDSDSFGNYSFSSIFRSCTYLNNKDILIIMNTDTHTHIIRSRKSYILITDNGTTRF